MVKQRPLVSIVCTVYNKASWLRQTLEGFLGQKEVTYEIIVVDDASTDGSRAIIEAFLQEHPDCVRAFYHDKNQGITRTWLSICQEAQGQYIARCDGDDYWLDPLKLRKQLDLMADSAAKWCGTDVNFVDSQGNLLEEAVFGQAKMELADNYETMLVTRGFTAPSTWLVERETMLRVNEMLKEDLATADDTFNLQLDLFHQTDFIFLPEVTVAYRVNEGSDSRPVSFVKLKQRFDQLLGTQYYYLDKYEQVNYKDMLKMLLKKHNDFSLLLSQKDYPVSQLPSQELMIFYTRENQDISDKQCLSYPLHYADELVFDLPQDTTAVRIDLSHIASFYQKISLVEQSYQTELLPSFTNAIHLGQHYFFNQDDPQVIYDVSHLASKKFCLSYQMFNVDDLTRDDYLTKLLVQELASYKGLKEDLFRQKMALQRLSRERDYYKKELEELVVRYNSVTHSRRWTIPTKLINLFRRR